jgi:hypothetical protein
MATAGMLFPLVWTKSTTSVLNCEEKVLRGRRSHTFSVIRTSFLGHRPILWVSVRPGQPQTPSTPEESNATFALATAVSGLVFAGRATSVKVLVVGS